MRGRARDRLAWSRPDRARCSGASAEARPVPSLALRSTPLHRFSRCQELAETIHLNETLGAPSARAMEKLFAAIEAEEAGAPRRRRRRISRPLSLGTAST